MIHKSAHPGYERTREELEDALKLAAAAIIYFLLVDFLLVAWAAYLVLPD